MGVTLKVVSLEKEVAFLREQGLLGDANGHAVELSRARTHGISIWLEE